MDNSFEYVFPAIRGVQAEREYFASMCPLRLIPKIFLFNEDEMVPELRAQRTLNKGRLPEMTRYILDNPKDYVFSAITASLDAEVRFEPFSEKDKSHKVGHLHIPMSATFIINDGQHRRAAIEMALKERPSLADETIAVVFFLDHGLRRCQQMFADLNRYAIRPSTSLGVLYDHRDGKAALAREVVARSPVFRDVVELEKSSLALRSRKLFTLSAIYSATSALAEGLEIHDPEELVSQIVEFWDELAKHIPEWTSVREGKMTAGEVRKEYLHSYGVSLLAFGRVGNSLLRKGPNGWKKRLASIARIDWHRSNGKVWEGRIMSGGNVSRSGHHVTLTVNAIKKALKLPLSPEEQRIEKAFKRGEYGKKD